MQDKSDIKFFAGNPTLFSLDNCFNANKVMIDGSAYCSRTPRGDLVPCDTMIPIQRQFGCDSETNRVINLYNNNDRTSYISKYNIDMVDKTTWEDDFKPKGTYQEMIKNDLKSINNMGGYAYNKTVNNPYVEGFFFSPIFFNPNFPDNDMKAKNLILQSELVAKETTL